MFTFDGLDIVAVTARRLCPRPLWEQIPRIREAGITRVILREKDLTLDGYNTLAERVLRACEDCDVRLTIHNFPKAAHKLGVKTLHVPLSLLTSELCYEFETVGTSVHSLEQLRQAESLGADYVTAGHIFATDCKKGLPPRGIEFLISMCANSSVPIYAIGGITADKFPELKRSGAAGACIMSEAMTF